MSIQSQNRKEETQLKRKYDRERKDYIYDLWERRGGELFIRLTMTGLPIIDIDDPGKIQFCHVRYQKKDKINSKWLKNLKSNKKWNIIARDEWCFYPIAIYPKSYSIEPKDQKYVFVAEYRSKKNGDRECYYSDRIETSFDGSILEWDSNNEHDPLTSLPKFPKSMLAKINRCLANNFLPDLWAGQGYAKWHRMDERIYRYMLTYDYESKPYIEPLLSLLRSDYGSAAAILLAFTCFSVAKPFFPRYRSLDKTSCYLQAKKYIPRQISINIKCDSPDVAIQLYSRAIKFAEAAEIFQKDML